MGAKGSKPQGPGPSDAVDSGDASVPKEAKEKMSQWFTNGAAALLKLGGSNAQGSMIMCNAVGSDPGLKGSVVLHSGVKYPGKDNYTSPVLLLTMGKYESHSSEKSTGDEQKPEEGCCSGCCGPRLQAIKWKVNQKQAGSAMTADMFAVPIQDILAIKAHAEVSAQQTVVTASSTAVVKPGCCGCFKEPVVVPSNAAEEVKKAERRVVVTIEALAYSNVKSITDEDERYAATLEPRSELVKVYNIGLLDSTDPADSKSFLAELEAASALCVLITQIKAAGVASNEGWPSPAALRELLEAAGLQQFGSNSFVQQGVKAF